MLKAAIVLAGTLLFLILVVWIPMSPAGAYEGVSGLATPVLGTVQATPTWLTTLAFTPTQIHAPGSKWHTWLVRPSGWEIEKRR